MKPKHLRIDQEAVLAALHGKELKNPYSEDYFDDEDWWDMLGEDIVGLSEKQLKRQKAVKVGMCYTNKAGEQMKRPVSIRAYAMNAEGEIYLNGFCFGKSACRSFRLDRIDYLFVLETGEMLEKERFFDLILDYDELKTIQPTPTQRALDRCATAVNLLLCIANIDGVLCDDELPVIVQYIEDECFDLPYDSDEIIRYLRITVPDNATFHDALAKTAKMDAAGFAKLWRTAGRLIAADGVQDESEFNAMLQLQAVKG